MRNAGGTARAWCLTGCMPLCTAAQVMRDTLAYMRERCEASGSQTDMSQGLGQCREEPSGDRQHAPDAPVPGTACSTGCTAGVTKQARM